MKMLLLRITVISAIAAVSYASSLQAQCPAGSVQVGERTERTPNLIIIHPQCWRLASDPVDLSAYDLTNFFNTAAADVNPTRDLDPDRQSRNCNKFFQAVGKQLNVSAPEWHDGLLADTIVQDITKQVDGGRGDWMEITDLTKIQSLANNGIIVVGGIRGSPGHLAFAAPAPPGLDLTHFGTWGPMVRDGNVHQGQVYDPEQGRKVEKIKPAGLGAVRADYAFSDYKSNPPNWFVWLPSCGSGKCGKLK